MKRNIHDYDDIIDLPHHQSASRPHMALSDRAAQFSPFAALTGYEDAVRETARLTDERIELEEAALAALNERLCILQDRIDEHPSVSITYFKPDEKKSGGAYVTVAGNVKHIDATAKTLLFIDGMVIPIMDIFDIQGEIFSVMDEF